jgi:lipopolysaccharide export system protein LptA
VKKVLLLIIFALIASHSFSQQTKRIELVRSDTLKGLDQNRVRIINPIFSHEGSTLAADSSNFNQQLNTFDAFGHIVITQTDGTTVRSDLLNYDGNTKTAVLTNNVRLLEKGGALLTTDHLTYNMETKVGIYTDNGKIVNKGDVLTSKNGYYFVNTKDAYFRYNVIITTKDAVVKADTMRYNTGTKLASFYGPTYIYGKKDTLYTELGSYNTDSTSRQAHGFKNNLYRQGSRTLKGDTIFYDDRKGTGKATGNMIFNDSKEQFSMMGDIGTYTRADSSTLVTGHSYISLVTQDSAKVDSIFMAADTLLSKVITKAEFIPVKRPVVTDEIEPASAEPEPQTGKRIEKIKAVEPKAQDTMIVKAPLPDTIKSSAPKDTSKVRVVFAYHHVKIFKSDLQARADSAFYSYADSIIRCYNKPMVWAQGSQLSADTILMQLKNNQLDNMLLQHNGLIVSTEGDSTKYNQIKGRLLTGTFKDNQLDQMFVDGNAESIYYTRDSTGYTGMNRTISSRIRLTFKDKALKNVFLLKVQDGKYYPMSKIKPETEILKGFMWKPKDRPKSKEEIIPPKPLKLASESAVENVKPKKAAPK